MSRLLTIHSPKIVFTHFVGGDMDALEERILDYEICLLAEETVKSDFRFDLETETAGALMARSQMVLMKTIIDCLMRLEDWCEFEPEMRGNLHLLRLQYQRARAAGDRHMARVCLARVRLLTRLLNRLGNFKRGRLIGLGFPYLDPGESPPLPALRRLKEELMRRGEWEEEAASTVPQGAVSLKSPVSRPDL